MKQRFILLLALLMVLILTGCNNGGDSNDDASDITVNSLEDIAFPALGTVTLRSALANAEEGQTILFDESLDGGTIALSIVGDAHSILKGEVMGMREEPSGPVSYLVGYFDRDYGQSALYARKNVEIDASALSQGITLSWTGGDDNPARVLAVYGDLTMTKLGKDLIPSHLWNNHPARNTAKVKDIIDLALKADVHISIVAGRIRREKNNYGILWPYVGKDMVRKLFFA